MHFKRTVFNLLLVAGLICSLPAQEKGLLRLDELITEALQNNPQLQAAKNRASAANSTIQQATSWDAPEIGVEFRQTPIKSFPNPVKGGMETDYYMQQMIPFPGKLSAMGDMAKNSAAMAEQEYHALEKKIIRELKTAYYELYLVQRKIQINAENQDLLRRFVDIAAKQYEVGMGLQPDILRAQTELSLLINEGITLQQEKKVVESMMNALLNHPINDSFGFVADMDITAPHWSFEQLNSLALLTRPEIKAMRFAIGMNQAEIKSAKLEYVPDLMGRVMYMDMMEDNDFWSLMLGVNIPLAFWSSGKYTGKVQESKYKLSKAEAESVNMVNMVSFEVREALVRVETNHNLLTLYENTVIPQAEQTLQSTIAAYQTGRTMFLMLIDAYRMLNMARLDYHMTVMNYLASVAALEQAVGRDVSEIAQSMEP